MSKNIWAEVESRIASGIVPVLKVSQAARVPMRGGKKGRPRRRDVNKPYDHYAMHTPGGKSPLSCRAPGCRRRMNANQQDIVCSAKCRALLTEYCSTLLSIINGELAPEELPSFMRTHKLKRILR
jgi:hypothetical protein